MRKRLLIQGFAFMLILIQICIPIISCAEKNDLAKLMPGDEIVFGKFMQDEEGCVLSPIEWVVLERNKNQIILISIKVLEALPFHDTFGGAYWPKCSLRKWLNNDFLNTAFSKEEQNAIVSTSHKSRIIDTNKEISSKEKVYILSDREAARYFCTNHSSAGNTLAEWDASDYEYVELTKNYYRAKDTAYARRVIKYSSVGKLSDNWTKDWWTRTANVSEFCPTVTGDTDTNFRIDWESCTDGYGVRPAIIIDLGKIKNPELIKKIE